MAEKPIKFQLRADPVTIQKLDQLAKQTGGNRSEVIRQLIDQAASTGQTQQQAQKVSC